MKGSAGMTVWKGGYPPRSSTTSAVGASPSLAGKKPVEESPAKVLLPKGGYLLGTSTPTAAMTPTKLASLSGAEDDVAYDARVAQVAERRA